MNVQVKKKDYDKMAKAFRKLGQPKDLLYIFKPLLKGAARVRRAEENLEKRKSRKKRVNIQQKVMDALPIKFTHGDMRRKIQEMLDLTPSKANQRAHSYGWQLAKRDGKLIVEGRGSDKFYEKILDV